MTFEQKLRNDLFSLGMPEDDVAAVIEKVKTDEMNITMKNRWNDKVDNYPPAIYSMLFRVSKEAALEWVNENCPQAWFKAALEI